MKMSKNPVNTARRVYTPSGCVVREYSAMVFLMAIFLALPMLPGCSGSYEETDAALSLLNMVPGKMEKIQHFVVTSLSHGEDESPFEKEIEASLMRAGVGVRYESGLAVVEDSLEPAGTYPDGSYGHQRIVRDSVTGQFVRIKYTRADYVVLTDPGSRRITLVKVMPSRRIIVSNGIVPEGNFNVVDDYVHPLLKSVGITIRYTGDY